MCIGPSVIVDLRTPFFTVIICYAFEAYYRLFPPPFFGSLLYNYISSWGTAGFLLSSYSLFSVYTNGRERSGAVVCIKCRFDPCLVVFQVPGGGQMDIGH